MYRPQETGFSCQSCTEILGAVYTRKVGLIGKKEHETCFLAVNPNMIIEPVTPLRRRDDLFGRRLGFQATMTVFGFILWAETGLVIQRSCWMKPKVLLRLTPYMACPPSWGLRRKPCCVFDVRRRLTFKKITCDQPPP